MCADSSKPSTYLVDPDRPISSRAEDWLGIYPFVKRLDRPLLGAPVESSLVLGLFAPWGYGKTSALNLLETALSESGGRNTLANERLPQPVLVRFTPWLYGSVETLLAAFFQTLASVIGDQPQSPERREKWKSALKGMGEFVAPAVKVGAMLLPTGGALVSAIGYALAGGMKAASEVIAGGEPEFHKRKAQAAEVLRELGAQDQRQRLVVLIDDLDRAGSEEVLAMLKLVKLVADLPNVSYVLAMDRARVQKALAKSVAPTYGRDFLDKIVQVGITLPPLDSSLLSRRTVEGAIEIARAAGFRVDELAVDWDTWEIIRNATYEIHLRRSLRTPRDVVRVLNSFSFAVLGGDTRADLHPVDLLLVCLLQSRFPTVYENVRQNKRFLLNEAEDLFDLSSSPDVKQRERARRKRRFSQIATESVAEASEEVEVDEELSESVNLAGTGLRGRLAPAIDILSELFPYALSRRPTEEERRKARLECRISSPEHFASYFWFDPPPDRLQSAEIDAAFRCIASTELDPHAIAQLAARIRHLSQSERESLSEGLLDRSWVMTLQHARAIRMSLPMLIGTFASDDADFPDFVVRIARRAAARLRNDPDDDSEAPREIGFQLLVEMIEQLPPLVAAISADELTHPRVSDLDLSDDEVRRIAHHGLQHGLEALERIPNVFDKRNAHEFGEIVWTIRRLADKAGEAEEHTAFPPLQDYVDGLLSTNPLLLSEVLALAAALASDDFTPAFHPLTNPSAVYSSLARITEVPKLKLLARLSIDAGTVSDMRWPYLVDEFAKWPIEHGPNRQ